jgi:transposase
METKIVVGIDISKDSFDVALPHGSKEGCYQHLKFGNTAAGFKQLFSHLPAASHCVMEASGVYYLPLAIYLHGQGMRVSVVNPLTIKRFAQMRLMRAKTDKKDAAIIAEYGKVEKPVLWQPRPQHMLQMQQLQTLQDNLASQLTRLKNQQQTFKSSGIENKFAYHLLVIEINHVKKQIALLQAELVRLTQAFHQDLFTRLQTIKGIGKRAAMTLILITDGFSRFENSKQLCAYVGLSPRIFESGTSVKGKAKICKMGMSRMRKLLYLCAMRARSCNKPCKEMFERLKERGKNGKLALIAIANKLLRQAFAIGKSQMSYQES